MAEEEEIPLDEGMPIENEAGDALGSLAGLLVEEGAEDAEFLLLTTSDAERLVPFDAVLGVGDGKLILDIPAESVTRFPKVTSEDGPTDDEMELAYSVYDEVGSDVADED